MTMAVTSSYHDTSEEMKQLSCFSRVRNSRVIILVIVFFALLTDSMLLTLVDPILPDMLARIDHLGSFSNSSEDLTIDINNNGRYGYLVASKGAAQFLFNPIVGVFVTKFGYRKPMLIGDTVLFGSTIAFAYSGSYFQLLMTRILQGLASSVTAVTGMALLAATYLHDDERSRAMGIGIGGLSFGVVIGPVYGSVLYEFVGHDVPFLVLAATILMVILLQIISMRSEVPPKNSSPVSAFFQLLSDPLILIVAGNIFLLNLDVSIVMAFLPIRLLEVDAPATWQLGLVVLPTSVGYLLASLIFPRIPSIPRWLRGFLGLFISVVCLVILGWVVTFEGMLIVTSFLGLALGMVSTAMQPIFAHLVDLKHGALYGNVYAISDMSVCLAMFLGPLVGGVIVYKYGFEWLVWGSAFLNICFCGFSFLLRDLSCNSSTENSIEKSSAPTEKTSLLERQEHIHVIHS